MSGNRESGLARFNALAAAQPGGTRRRYWLLGEKAEAASVKKTSNHYSADTGAERTVSGGSRAGLLLYTR